KKWENFLERRVQALNAPTELLLDLQRIVILLDLEICPEHLQDRQVGGRLAVCHTVTFEPGHAVPFQGPVELVQEARLPHPRLPHDAHHLAAAGIGASEALM